MTSLKYMTFFLLLSAGLFAKINDDSTIVNGLPINHEKLASAINWKTSLFDNVGRLTINSRFLRTRFDVTFYATVQGKILKITCDNLEVDNSTEEVSLKNCSSDNGDRFHSIILDFSQLS